MSHQPSSGWAPPTGGDELRRLLISGLPADVKPRELLHIFGSCPGFESSALVPHMASVLYSHCCALFSRPSAHFHLSFAKFLFQSCNRVEFVNFTLADPTFRIVIHAASRISNFQFDGECGGRARQISGALVTIFSRDKPLLSALFSRIHI
jgi:hypothetical protein